MKRILIILIAVVPFWASGQNTNPATFTLDDCLRYALDNTVDVKNARVDEQIAKARVRETTGIGLPQVDASVGIVHNQKLPRFFGPNTNDSTSFSFFQNIEGANEGDIVAGRNFFQLPSSGDAALRINQLLFSSSYLIGLKAAKTYKDLASKNTELTEIQIMENVMKAYYGVLVNDERITLFDNNIARVDSLLHNTRALQQNGFAEEIDVDRIMVTLNNLKSERLKFINLQNLSMSLLKYQMNYPMDQELKLAGDLSQITIDEQLLDSYGEGWDFKDRIEYQVLETQRGLLELDLKNKYAVSLPSLSAFANLGYSTQSPDISGLFKTNTNIPDRVLPSGQQVGPDKWYSYSTFGVTLNIPIFSGLQRTYQAQQAKLELLKTSNSITALKQSIDLSIQQNSVTYENSIETLKSQDQNMDLAEKVARITKIKYEQGVGSNIEVIEAESSLREAQVNYYNALFDALIAKVDLDKAFAKIDPNKYVSSTK